MKNNIILICILCLFAMNLYSLICLKNKESMTNTISKKEFKKMMKEIYNIDVNDLKRLSKFAKEIR
jgi:hypothetical protein